MLKQKIVTGVIRLVNQNQTLFWDDPAPANSLWFFAGSL